MTAFDWLNTLFSERDAQQGINPVGLDNVQGVQSAGTGHTDWQNNFHAPSNAGLSQKCPAPDARKTSTLYLHVTVVETKPGTSGDDFQICQPLLPRLNSSVLQSLCLLFQRPLGLILLEA